VNISIWSGPATAELSAAMAALIPQLSRSNPPPAPEELDAIVSSPTTDLFVATEEDGTIVGTATLAVFRIPTGVRAWIEDVVVDGSTEGRGVGSALTHAMLDRARGLGCVTVDLTSRPSREAANRLYQRLGFEPRETNVYRYTFRADDPSAV
jgi:ribosomal protein S18 acetylase RimI-like enzyme